MCKCVCAYVYVRVCKYQSFDKQTSSHHKGGGVSRWGEWVGKATAHNFDTCTLIGVHSTMHLVDPIKVHVSYTCVCMCVCVCACVCVCVYRTNMYIDCSPLTLTLHSVTRHLMTSSCPLQTASSNMVSPDLVTGAVVGGNTNEMT